jgi:hypothetical protein
MSAATMKPRRGVSAMEWPGGWQHYPTVTKWGGDVRPGELLPLTDPRRSAVVIGATRNSDTGAWTLRLRRDDGVEVGMRGHSREGVTVRVFGPGRNDWGWHR